MRPVAAGLLLFLSAGSALGADFYRVVQEKGVWWLSGPDGKKIVSRGVDGFNPGVPVAKYDQANPAYCALRTYPSEEKWRATSLERIRKWGFNTLGGGADEGSMRQNGFAYAVQLNLGRKAGVPWADPDSPAARAVYQKELAAWSAVKNDTRMIGWFTDNGLGWWDETLFLAALKQGPKSALKTRALELVTAEYGGDLRRFLADFEVEPAPKTFDDLRGAMKRADFRPGFRPLMVERYVEWLADRYYRAVTAEIRRFDSNHLVLGDRYQGYYSQPVVIAAGRYLDVVSANYNTFAPQGWTAPFYFESLWSLSRKPVLVSEYYFSAKENSTGCANTNGPYMAVNTQAERATGARALTEWMARFPFIVGWHWFSWADQPAGGRDEGGGGEDFNMGLVDVKDGVYPELSAALARANATSDVPGMHGSWEAKAGMSRGPEGWSVPQLSGLPQVDGSPDEWTLERSWIPAVKGAAPFERWGDLYLAWHPEGVAVLVTYMDYRDRPGRPGRPETDSDRLTIGVGIEDEKPVVLTLRGIMEKKDGTKGQAEYYTPEVITVRGGVVFPAEGRLLVAQRSRGTHAIIELFLPAALFKREKLDSGAIMRCTMSLRLRANFKELFWPRTFRTTDYADGKEWAPLILEAAQNQ